MLRLCGSTGRRRAVARTRSAICPPCSQHLPIGGPRNYVDFYPACSRKVVPFIILHDGQAVWDRELFVGCLLETNIIHLTLSSLVFTYYLDSTEHSSILLRHCEPRSFSSSLPSCSPSPSPHLNMLITPASSDWPSYFRDIN